jgi:heavy metal efflux system protein
VKIVPYYDRTSLVGVTTHTVLHNLVFGCLLVFIIQWVFLGDLRSAIIVGINIPFALFFAIILLVLQGEDANLLSLGAVDFGIIVDSAVIVVENIFRNFQSSPQARSLLLEHLAEGQYGVDPSNPTGAKIIPRWTERLRMLLVSVLQVDRAVFFSAAITVAAFVPLFTMQGVEGRIFGPMARTYGYALAGALIATFTVTPVLASFLVPEKVNEVETFVVRALRRLYSPALRYSLSHQKLTVAGGGVFLLLTAFLMTRLGSEFLPALEEGNFWIRASMPPTLSLEAGREASARMREILLRHPEVITVVSQHGRPDNGSDASPFSNVELFAPLKPFDEWPRGLTKEKLTEQLQTELAAALPGVGFNFSQYIQDNVEESISGVKGANSVKIIGPNLEVLEKLADQVKEQMSRVRRT